MKTDPWVRFEKWVREAIRRSLNQAPAYSLPKEILNARTPTPPNRQADQAFAGLQHRAFRPAVAVATSLGGSWLPRANLARYTWPWQRGPKSSGMAISAPVPGSLSRILP